MILNVVIDEQTLPVKIPDEVLTEAEDFFQRMNQDMDKGWQMSRQWIDNPNNIQRCQIAADKILTAIEFENNQLAVLMAAYILKHMPGIKAVDVDTTGDVTATEFIMYEETSEENGLNYSHRLSE